MTSLKIESGLLAMPSELRTFTLQNCISASPYNRYAGGSFYSKADKTWDYTQDGTIRVSDHWNFESRGTTHCVTDIDNSKLEGKWVVARYNTETGIYSVISADEKDFTAITKQRARQNNKSIEVSASFFQQKRVALLAAKREERRRAARAKKINNKSLWVSFDIKTWAGSGRRVRFAGYETVFGQLVYESGCKMIIEVNGHQTEYRACTNYKEFDRKPYTKLAASY